MEELPKKKKTLDYAVKGGLTGAAITGGLPLLGFALFGLIAFVGLLATSLPLAVGVLAGSLVAGGLYAAHTAIPGGLLGGAIGGGIGLGKDLTGNNVAQPGKGKGTYMAGIGENARAEIAERSMSYDISSASNSRIVEGIANNQQAAEERVLAAARTAEQGSQVK